MSQSHLQTSQCLCISTPDFSQLYSAFFTLLQQFGFEKCVWNIWWEKDIQVVTQFFFCKTSPKVQVRANYVWNARKNLRNQVRTHRLSANHPFQASRLSKLVEFKFGVWNVLPEKFPIHWQHRPIPGKPLGKKFTGVCSVMMTCSFHSQELGSSHHIQAVANQSVKICKQKQEAPQTAAERRITIIKK